MLARTFHKIVLKNGRGGLPEAQRYGSGAQLHSEKQGPKIGDTTVPSSVRQQSHPRGSTVFDDEHEQQRCPNYVDGTGDDASAQQEPLLRSQRRSEQQQAGEDHETQGQRPSESAGQIQEGSDAATTSSNQSRLFQRLDGQRCLWHAVAQQHRGKQALCFVIA